MEMKYPKLRLVSLTKGGVGSGFHDHEGRPDFVGGSLPDRYAAFKPSYGVDGSLRSEIDSVGYTESEGESRKYNLVDLNKRFGDFSEDRLDMLRLNLHNRSGLVGTVIRHWIEDKQNITELKNLFSRASTDDALRYALMDYEQLGQWAFHHTFGDSVSLFRGMLSNKTVMSTGLRSLTAFTSKPEIAQRFGKKQIQITAKPEDVVFSYLNSYGMELEGEFEFLTSHPIEYSDLTITQKHDKLSTRIMSIMKHQRGKHDQKRHGVWAGVDFNKFPVSADLQAVADKLSAAGFKSYVVGGAVRDFVSGKTPKDFDLTTDATPMEMKVLFGKQVRADLNGEAHGTVRIKQGQEVFEITTHRKDIETDGRRATVAYTTNLLDDLQRRDLTCNAMALDLHTKKVYGTGPKGSAVDNVIDIKDKTIRFVGNGLDRIKEDRLRALRAIRFAVRMGAQLHPEAKQAIKNAVDQGLIVIPSEQLSGERIRNELISTLGYKDGRRAIRMYQDTGLLYAMFPELKPAETQYQNKHHGDVMVLEHILRTVEAVDEMPKGDYSIFTPFSTILTGKRVEDVTDDDRANTARGLLRFTMLMHDIAKPTVAAEKPNAPGEFSFLRHEEVGAKVAEDITRRLKFPTLFANLVSMGVAEHMTVPDESSSESSIRRWARRLVEKNPDITQHGLDVAEWMLAIRNADWSAIGRDTERQVGADRIRSVLNFVPKVAKPPISGDKIMALTGLKPGREIGQIVRAVSEFLDATPNASQEVIESEVMRIYNTLK
jgi:tRNA nucleotidyltransferase/poly(A) polymerase